MSDNTPVAPVCHKTESGLSPTWIYVLYLVALFTWLPVFIGVILAYISNDKTQEPESSHYQYQIRTFWLAALYVVAGLLLTPIFGLGLLVCLFAWVFILIRSIKGLQWYNNCEPVPDPKTWLW
jgi:uncharacterized membrane protein